MSDWMLCEVEGVTFRKSSSPESDVVMLKVGNDYTTAYADLNVGSDEEKFRLACEGYMRRLKNGSKKAKPVVEDEVVIEEGADV